MKLPKVDCSRGAPMGRPDIEPERDPPRVVIARVPLTVDGAYDAGGAYWGSGQPLWCVHNHGAFELEEEIVFFYRADTKDDVREYVKNRWPTTKIVGR